MTVRKLRTPRPVQSGPLKAAIFDVDGVLLASPHEQAWREALRGFAEPARFTSALYQAHVAGKSRLDGARAALEALGVPDADRQAISYAECKQRRLEELIEKGEHRRLSGRPALCSGGGGAGMAYGGRVIL